MKRNKYLRKIWWNEEGSTPQFWENKIPKGNKLAKSIEYTFQDPIAYLIKDYITTTSLALDAGCGPMIWANVIRTTGAC